MDKYYTESNEFLKDFGYQEIYELSLLLQAYLSNEKNKTIIFNELNKIGFNLNSGNVFLIDENDNIAMLHGDNLEDFITLPSGEEDFLIKYLEKYKKNKMKDYDNDDVNYIEKIMYYKIKEGD